MDEVTVLFINNDGGGFANHVKVAAGTTLAQFFADRMKGSSASDFKIRVNRAASVPEYVLRDRDMVSVTPLKVAGADV